MLWILQGRRRARGTGCLAKNGIEKCLQIQQDLGLGIHRPLIWCFLSPCHDTISNWGKSVQHTVHGHLEKGQFHRTQKPVRQDTWLPQTEALASLGTALERGLKSQMTVG